MAYEVIRSVLVTAVVSFLTVDGAYPTSCGTIVQAVCNLKTNPNMNDPPGQIEGSVSFHQRVTEHCRRLGRIRITYNIQGLPTNDGTEDYGIHVHQSNDTSNGCESMGPHFNPLNTQHGAPRDTHDMRHLGDLGNVHKSGSSAKNSREEHLLNLVGPNSIIGLGLVLHAKKDDLGLRGDAGSQADGNSGSPLACCVIEHEQYRETKRTFF